MFTPYNPCDNCTQPKEMCCKCGYKAALTNYDRALETIKKLSAELNKPITILA